MEKEEFQKKLAELGALAAKNEKRLTNRQVRDFFDALELSEEQYELIFAYLASRQVVVEGYVPAKKQEEERQAQVPLTPEEESFLRSYQKDLDRLELLEEAELLELCRQVEETGDDLLKARLTEQLLPEVLRLADEFRGREVQLGDLVQEGNIGLLLALETLGMRPAGSSALSYLREEICKAISQAVEDHCTEKEAGSHLAQRLNELSDQIRKLTDELERQVSVDELAVYMDMPVEEIEDLLKLAGEGTGEEAGEASR